MLVIFCLCRTIRFHVVTVVNYTQPVLLKTPPPKELLSGVEQVKLIYIYQ